MGASYHSRDKNFSAFMTTTHTILVVEDNDFVRLQIVTFLKGAGYNTLEARDGDAALDVFDKEVALAIVDVRMEPVGGFAFISAVRENGYKTPVILITGDQDSDLLERASKHGVSVVLLKPVEKERLITSVARLIERGSRS